MISFKDNSEIFIDELHEKLEEALIECGELAKEYAKQRCPVRTGALRNSIDYSVENASTEGSVKIVAGMPYWKYVEFGTSKMKAQPYLKPSIAEHKEEYIKLITAKLKE